LKFNNPERIMEVGQAVKIIEVCLYLLALLPGKDWGTSLILSLLAPFWSLYKVTVNAFKGEEITVSPLAYSLADMLLISLLWIGLLWTLLSITSRRGDIQTQRDFGFALAR